MKIYTVMDSSDSFWVNSHSSEEIKSFVDIHLEEVNKFDELHDDSFLSYINAYHSIHCEIEGCSKKEFKIFLSEAEFKEEIINLKRKIELMGAELK